jgi:hypothetical protein
MVVALWLPGQLAAGPLASEAVPEPLRPWVPWVLHQQEQRLCPLLYRSEAERRCAWPSRLVLALDAHGGTFAQRWRVFAESWVTLPGDARHWPQAVRLGEAEAVVLERDGSPALWLGPGEHQVSGRFEWSGLPEALRVPSDIGLVSLTVSGESVTAPEIEPDGRLWLKGGAGRGESAGRPADALDLRVFRRLVDEVPFQVVTRLDLEVAGEPREELLGPVLPADSVPLSLESALPARIEPDGRLRVQVRPGRWPVVLTARFPGPVGALACAAVPAPWPPDEVWVLDARPQLRVVEPGGLEAIDPRQTTLPPDWQGLPTFRARPGDRLVLAERRRGDPEPDPDRLSLARTVWLDFDGGGATVQDRITGVMTRGWRLEAAAPLALGRVALDGTDQLITRLPGAEREGVEVRRGRLSLVADSRLVGDPSRLPAVGWDHDFQKVGATLNLPPGWRLLAATGVDRVQHAWLTRWTLFDLFLLLVATAAVGKLWGWGWGGLALLALGLGYHEAGMPRAPWLYLLAAVALLRVLPEGRLRAAAGVVRWVSLVALVVLALPYLVDQVRMAIYPALERPWQVVGVEREAEALTRGSAEAPAEALAEEEAAPVAAAPPRDYYRSLPSSVAPKMAGVPALEGHDPKAAVQTGPGLPRWTWEAVSLAFSGPVEAGAQVRLMLLPPLGTRLWRLLAAGLLVVLVVRVAWPVRRRRPGGGDGPAPAAAAALVLLLAGAGALAPSPAQAADFPPADLMQDLQARLLEPPDCVPRCAEVPRLALETADGQLRLRLEVVALAEVAVPLPGVASHWLPTEVLVDGHAASALSRDGSGGLWAHVGRGAHQILLAGPLPDRPTVELPLPLRPRRVELGASDWRVEGIGPDGVPEPVVRLSREHAAPGPATALAPTSLPPFLTLERTLRLGLEWQVETRVLRASPTGPSIVAELPLIEGEAITTPGIRVERGNALVTLGPEQEEAAWSSTLARSETLRLTAPRSLGWTEVWRLDLGPTWHIELAGIAPIHRESQDRWLPEWRPWPGEGITVRVTRPEGVAAPTLTLDGAELKVRPGQRSTDASLDLRIRSSQGGQTAVGLPAGARLQAVTLDGVAQPVRQDGERVLLPVRPGAQRVVLAWRDAGGAGARYQTPAVDLGHPAVNVALTVEVPLGRWVLLTSGPSLGPAVLFWGVLAVVLIAAVGLGRLRLTPLRGRDWALLGVGLSQAPAWAAVVVVGWLLALGARGRVQGETPPWRFNLMQVALAVLTVTALALLFDAIRQGLLGLPEMQIAGNGSSGSVLRWYQDRSGPELPRAGVLSAPLWAYRLLMLGWALWLAFALLGWLRWGWESYRTGGLWRSVNLLPRKSRIA